MTCLLETTLPQLIQQTAVAFPETTKRHNNVNSVSTMKVDLIPAAGALIAKGTVRGSSGTPYECVIQFDDVTYNPEEGEQSSTFASNGDEYTISSISKNEADVKVRCTCLDFRFRFAQYNHSDGSLQGEAPDLYAKAPGSKRGPANPTKTPGVCKHLIELTNSLEQSGLFS